VLKILNRRITSPLRKKEQQEWEAGFEIEKRLPHSWIELTLSAHPEDFSLAEIASAMDARIDSKICIMDYHVAWLWICTHLFPFLFLQRKEETVEGLVLGLGG
jgi:hypothetical protein